MPRHPTPLPEALETLFSTAQAAALGVSGRRLGHVDVERLFRGVYRRLDRAHPFGSDGARPSRRDGDASTHPAVSWRERQMLRAHALGAGLPSGVFFCGRTAAVLWGLPVPPAATDEVELACFPAQTPPSRAGVRGRRIHPAFATVTTLGGLPVTDPTTTWVMLAARLDLRDGVALGDAVIREPRIPGTRRLRRPPHATIDELETAASVSRLRGGARLRQMLPLLSPHSASAPESHFRLLLREWGAPVPRLDYDVYGSNGLLLGCSEFAYPEFKLAFEYEGRHHLIETRQWNRDIEKYRLYAQAGWEPVRVTAELQYLRPDELRRQTFEALIRRGWSGGS